MKRKTYHFDYSWVLVLCLLIMILFTGPLIDPFIKEEQILPGETDLTMEGRDIRFISGLSFPNNVSVAGELKCVNVRDCQIDNSDLNNNDIINI